MNNSLLNLLGMASRARRLSYGFADSRSSVMSGKSRLVIVAADISQKTAKEVRFVCTKHSVGLACLDFTQDELTHAIGKRAGVISINDDGFANKAQTLITAANGRIDCL